MDEKKLFLLDAYALIYRAYYALIRSPRVTSDGFNASAVFGFCNTLQELLRKENPTHIAVCFDPHGPTFRHEMYAEYKANREAQPEDISRSVPIIKELIEAYNIPVFEVAGYEADDVIGTLAGKASAAGYTTYMMTPDKDYGQLVTDNVYMYRPSLRGEGFEVRGVAEVCEKYEISTPLQVIDLLALEGDASDNIPGCPGVGAKTAVKLIKEYGSVENMLTHADEIKGALGQKVRDNADKIRFSKDLATIRRDVPVEVDFDTLRRAPEDVEKLREIFTRLEFKTFLSKLPGKGVPAASATVTTSKQGGEGTTPKPRAKATPTDQAMGSLFDFIESDEVTSEADTTNPASYNEQTARYTTATDIDAIARTIAEARQAKTIGIALCAVGDDAMTATLKGVAISTAPGVSTFVELPDDLSARQAAIDQLRTLPATDGITVVSHDIKRDMVVLGREAIEIGPHYFDTSLAHYVLQPEMRHRLADMALSLLHYQTIELPADNRRTRSAALTPEQRTALCESADVTLRLMEPLRALLQQNSQLQLVEDIELPMARVLADMESTGVRIDTAELHRQGVNLSQRLKEMEQQAYDLAGEPFNINSPMQVGEMLFGKLKLDPKAKRTKTGGFSTAEDVLEKYKYAHPLVNVILEVRGLKKLLSTYINALPEMVNPVTGKIHTVYNQSMTATGRLSSSNPNLQNIPIRTPDGREVRRAFIADEGCKILSADYSQIELRLLAALSHDPDLTEAFLQGLDIHRATAAKIYHVPFEEVTDDQRRNAKTANFGTVYGISAFGLAERLGISRTEARELIDGYFRTYPHIREYINEMVEQARRDGYVSTIMGRKRFLPDINSRNATVRSFAERNAVNAPLQGSAADIIKIAMIRIHNEMKSRGMRSRMIIQVHDELVFNAVEDELPQLKELVERQMPAAFSGTVPLEVAAGVGDNWLEAH
jgi:DNA polymerase-1